MKVLVLFFLFFISYLKIFSCEIILTIEKGQKEKYKKGDEIIVKVEVQLTHRNCTHVIDEIKFEQYGIKILSATKWKETDRGVWVRKLKIKITAEKEEKAKLEIKRICEKGGTIKLMEFNTK